MKACLQIRFVTTDYRDAIFNCVSKKFQEVLVPFSDSIESFIVALAQDSFQLYFGIRHEHLQTHQLIIQIVVIVRLEKFEVSDVCLLKKINRSSMTIHQLHLTIS